MKKYKVYNVSINEIGKAIDYMTEYRKSVLTKTELFVRKLAELGVPIIDDAIAQAKGDSNKAYYHTYITMQRGETVTARLILEGEDVLFFEFGAGVHYNGHPGGSTNPSVVTQGEGWELTHKGGVELGYTIGSYGKHQGLNDSWFYRDNMGQLFRSFGTEATMPMYSAELEMINRIRSIAKEVFG